MGPCMGPYMGPYWDPTGTLLGPYWCPIGTLVQKKKGWPKLFAIILPLINHTLRSPRPFFFFAYREPSYNSDKDNAKN